MDLRDLGTATRLWRRWVLLAAGHAALDRPGFEIRRSDGCGHLEDGRGAWLRMRRLGGHRAVIWGHHPAQRPDPGFGTAVLDNAPDWAYEVDSAHGTRNVGFVGWFAHGSWSCVPTQVPDEVAGLLAPIADDEVVTQWWHHTWPEAKESSVAAAVGQPDGPALAAVVGAAAAARAVRQVSLGSGWVGHQISDTATAHLRAAIHQQMRTGSEIGDRDRPARPPLLRQWARVNLTGATFRHAVCAVSTTPELVAAANDTGLTEPGRRSLDNVLRELRTAETDEESGAWLFARVTGEGRGVRLERAYDSWPAWYVASGTGPTMGGLHAEMTQRAARWRPQWASLLPVERF